MRAIWKGHIRFSLVTIPVRIYNAVDSSQTIRFNQLHRECNGAVGYDKKCKKCQQILPAKEIVKGYQYEPDQYVLVNEEDIQKIKLKSTKIIEIEGFVSAEEIHPTLYDAPYYAGPDGDVAAKAYGLLAAALKETSKMGIGRVVLRDREEVVMIAPHEGGLILYKLRYPAELRHMKDVPQLDGQTIDEEQMKLARSLVDSMSASLADIKFSDGYKSALREMIEAKVSGKEVVTLAEEERPVVDIMTALKMSIEQAKEQKKPMVRAKGQKTAVKKAKQRKSA